MTRTQIILAVSIVAGVLAISALATYFDWWVDSWDEVPVKITQPH